MRLCVWVRVGDMYKHTLLIMGIATRDRDGVGAGREERKTGSEEEWERGGGGGRERERDEARSDMILDHLHSWSSLRPAQSTMP